MVETVIHFFLAVFGFSLTSIFFDFPLTSIFFGFPLTSIFFGFPLTSFFGRNIRKRTWSASRLNVAASSGELLIPSTEAAFGKLGTTGTSFDVRLASGVCEAWLGDTSTNSLVNFCGLRETGAGEAELETLRPAKQGFQDCIVVSGLPKRLWSLAEGMTGFPVPIHYGLQA